MKTEEVNSYYLFKGTITYTLGAVLRKGVNFILLPVYTAALAASGYGALAMLTVFGGIVTMSLNFGLGSAITVNYKELKDAGREKTAENSIISFLLLTSAAALLVLNLTCPLYAHRLVKVSDSPFLVRLYLLEAVSNMLVELFYALLRLRFQNTKHIIIILSNFVGSTSLILFFVLVLKWGIKGVILGMLIPSVCTLAYFLISWGYKPEFNKKLFKPLLRFGIWLVPGNLGALIYTFSDRFFIQEYFTVADVGIYSLAVKLSTMITVFMLKPFKSSFSPYIFQQNQGLQHGIDLGLKFLLILSGLGFLGISLAGKPIIQLMATREFLPAASVIPILLLVEITNGLIQVFAVGIHKAGKSYISSMIIWTGAVLNIGLNFLLIPRYKIFGAALATLVTYMVMISAYFYFSNKEVKYRLDYRFILVFILAVSVFYFVGSDLIDATKNIAIKIIDYGFIMGCFLLATYLILSKTEKMKLKNLIRKRITKRDDKFFLMVSDEDGVG